MDYIPTQPQQPQAPAAEYVLVEDVTGKPPPKRGVQILSDTKGHQLKVPYPPKANCRRCYGRGYVGVDLKIKQLTPCRKCYPFNGQ